MTTLGTTLPTGTVTFLRTDVEGSMAHARALGPTWDEINATHLGLIRAAVDTAGGVLVRTEGDAVFAVFPEAAAAIRAAVAGQRDLTAHEWPADALVRVRMGLHTGEAHLAGDDYGGFDVNRAARVAAVGHGGQIILSATTRELTAESLPDGCSTRELGRYVLKDVPRPERLFQLDAPGLQVEFPPLRAGQATIGNLDDRLTSFIGRDRELADLIELAARTRLLTLTGPGGIGKSSLAIEFARRVEADYADGAWFVPLAPLDDAATVPGQIARSIGLFDGPTRSAADALPAFLSERSMLLVLDNFEHVMAAADIVPTLLRAAPHLRILVTSRAPLHLSGEQEVPVAPLGRTDTGAAARLFGERARAIRPEWEAGPDAPAVDEICTLLDGLPLGVELAAARVALLPVPAIRDRLAARLPLPGSGPRDAPARQRTLEGAVAWSHELLEPAIQRVLHRLSVFDGGFADEQASSVAGDGEDVLDAVSALVDQSLVERDPWAPGIRFRLLQTVRAFAAARLAEAGATEATRRRHADAFLALATEAKRREFTLERATWLDRLAADEANLRAAVRWSIEAGDADRALRLVAALWRFWQADGHLAEGRDMADRALAMPGAEAPTAARMWALGAAGSLAYWQGDMVATRERYEAQVALARTLGDEPGIADALFNRAHVDYIDATDAEAGRRAIGEALERYRAIGDTPGVARVEWAIGNAAIDGGEIDQALAIFHRSRATFLELGDPQYAHMAAATLAWAEFRAGDQIAAAQWALIGLREAYATHDLATATISLHIGVLIAIILGETDAAARLTGAFDAGCERYGVRPPAALERFLQVGDLFGQARAGMSPEAWDLEYAAGRRMSLGEAVDLATSLPVPPGIPSA